jgi:hypothetical protein
MATRSRIGLELADGSILSAYHHWDGYESWLGRILRTHYNSKELAAELIDGGDMSSCWNDDNQPDCKKQNIHDRLQCWKHKQRKIVPNNLLMLK